MERLTYYGRVSDGVIKIQGDVRQDIIDRFDGKSIRLMCDERKGIRTKKQNSYYWAVVIPEFAKALYDLGNKIQPDTEETHLTLHATLLGMFVDNGQEITLPTLQTFKIASSSKIMTTSEYTQYIKDIRDFAAESLGYYIPEPEEQKEIDFKLRKPIKKE